jgi:hypothetical protein
MLSWFVPPTLRNREGWGNLFRGDAKDKAGPAPRRGRAAAAKAASKIGGFSARLKARPFKSVLAPIFRLLPGVL